MKSKVRISLLLAGMQSIFTKNEGLGKDNKQYGFYRVDQTIVDQSSGVDRILTVSALRSITEEDFNKAKDFLTPGLELPGTIQRIESMVEEKGFTIKRAGSDENAPACTVGGKPIYQKTVYNPDANAQDVLIAHDNGEEIKAFQAELKKSVALNGK